MAFSSFVLFGAKVVLIIDWDWIPMKIFQFVVILYLRKQFFPIFALPFREKSEWPEKAHSSLCSLMMNLHNSHKRRLREEVAFAVMLRLIKPT